MRHVPLPGDTIIAAIRFAKITGKAMGTPFAQKMSRVSFINALPTVREGTPAAQISIIAHEKGDTACLFRLCA